MFENFTTNVTKILDLRSSSEEIFSKNQRWVPLVTVQENNFQHWCLDLWA